MKKVSFVVGIIGFVSAFVWRDSSPGFYVGWIVGVIGCCYGLNDVFPMDGDPSDHPYP